VALLDLIVWNIQIRAERLQKWAEGAERQTDEALRLTYELEVLVQGGLIPSAAECG